LEYLNRKASPGIRGKKKNETVRPGGDGVRAAGVSGNRGAKGKKKLKEGRVARHNTDEAHRGEPMSATLGGGAAEKEKGLLMTGGVAGRQKAANIP